MNMRELFRIKLENSEVIPGDSVRKGLMRKLAVKEFIRLNPFRFNIYYLSGIVAAAFTAIFIFTAEPANIRKQNESILQKTAAQSDTVSFAILEKDFSGEKTADTRSVVKSAGKTKSSIKSEFIKDVENFDSKAIGNRKDSAGINRLIEEENSI
jgi:hypothetical protein